MTTFYYYIKSAKIYAFLKATAIAVAAAST